jgi:translation initiation factor IF-2
MYKNKFEKHLEKLQGKSSKGKGAKYRREKRDQHREQTEIELRQKQQKVKF